MRRQRRTDGLRRLARETRIHPDDLILPLFVVAGKGREEPIASMPGVSRQSVDVLRKRVATLAVPAVLLFGVPEECEKDADGTAALRVDALAAQAVRELKRERPDLVVITDLCLCGYTSHGHCGLLDDAGDVRNDATNERLGAMACLHAEAGAEMVAPSAMMDGQVGAIRDALDAAGHHDTAIMAYAAKFASAFYGPFREAAQSAPAFGDRRAYQLPPANAREAVRDALLDEREGADWLMVKPAMPYLDVLSRLHAETRLPLAAYQVSGEYAMLKCAAFDERAAVLESLIGIKRAGADAIITYYAEEVSKWLREE